MASPKAMAAVPGTSKTWRMTNFASTENAEERVLEACQVQYDAPCVLVALNDKLAFPADSSTWQTRNMARATYGRQFDP